MSVQGSVAEALAGLVHQFADPMACFRELIQNAVDAGSAEIDVRFEHVDGRLQVHIDDFGEGMDRTIIDTKLTRLFSSSKEDDRTKIGRFGIGFVSVFALDPEVVCLDTSRAGEHWRVIFRPDRSFTRVALPDPIEGTKITIYKPMDAKAAEAFAARARAVIGFWCRHVPAEIRVDGESISRPFALDLPCTVSAEVGEARVVVGHDLGMDSSIGYYNRGLTLLEERPGPFPGVHVKLWSPELEHTMTRDNVLRDEGHARALAHARAQVEGPLRARLIAVLAEQAAARPDEPHRRGDADDRTMAHLLRLFAARVKLPREAWSAPLVRRHHAGPVDLTTLKQASEAGRVYWAERASPLTRALHERGDVVIAAVGEPSVNEPEPQQDGLPWVCALPQALTGEPAPRLNAVLCTCVPVADPPGWERLRPVLVQLLAEVGPRPRAIAIADLDYPGSSIDRQVAIAQDEVGGVTRTDALRLSPGQRLVVHVGHPAVASAIALAAREPEFAAYKLAKLIHLADGLDLADDHGLTHRALELRWQRMT